MTDSIESERLVLFAYTLENLRLFNSDLAAFEKAFGVTYQGEELDHLLTDFLKKLEKEIEDDPKNYLFFTEFLIVLKKSDRIIGSIDYKYRKRGHGGRLRAEPPIRGPRIHDGGAGCVSRLRQKARDRNRPCGYA